MTLDDQMQELVKQCLVKKEPVYFSAHNVPITFQTELKGVEADALKLRNAVAPAYIQQVVNAKSFSLQVNTLHLESDHIGSDGDQIVFPILGSQQKSDIRREQRRSFAAQESAVCEFVNPYDMQTVLRKPVIDISPSGLSIRNACLSKLFDSGTILPELKVLVNGGEYIKRAGEVVYSRQVVNLKGEHFIQTGIRFR